MTANSFENDRFRFGMPGSGVMKSDIKHCLARLKEFDASLDADDSNSNTFYRLLQQLLFNTNVFVSLSTTNNDHFYRYFAFFVFIIYWSIYCAAINIIYIIKHLQFEINNAHLLNIEVMWIMFEFSVPWNKCFFHSKK